jgi:4'-phosphopantetheinyl transferase
METVSARSLPGASSTIEGDGRGMSEPWPCDLWLLTDVAMADVDLSATTSAEKAQAARMLRRDRAELFLRLRGAMRTILGWYTHLPPREVPLEVAPAGKPLLPGQFGRIEFNLSHTQGLAVLVVTESRSVGVDIEHTHQELDVAAIAQRFFNPDEQAYLFSHEAGPARKEVFFRLWTRKEAFLKEGGRGLAGNLTTVNASSWPVEGGPLPCQTKVWQPLDLPAGYVGAVVAAGPQPIRLKPRPFRVTQLA